ncbi:hypothetical protein HJFPF1_10024 [Paramyrothecium foliicola]|nr:hypothetical protein HJFPF1_10024 [Paramyrothecium foliicola]
MSLNCHHAHTRPSWKPATHPCGERRSTFLTGRGTRRKLAALESLQYRPSNGLLGQGLGPGPLE